MKTRYIKVAFDASSKLYNYKTRLDVEVGDFVVVQTYTRSYAVARVAAVNDEPNSMARKWALWTPDLDEIRELEQDDRDREQAVENIKSVLDEKLKEKKKLGKYAVLSDDPEAVRLIRELAKLEGTI